MNTRLNKTLIAFVLAFIAGVVVSLANQIYWSEAIMRALGFALLVALIVAVLAWGSDNAAEKGYPSWLGFWLVALLNVIGMLIIWLLPDLKRNHTS